MMFFTLHQSCQKVAEIPNVMRCNKVAFSYSQLFENILKSWYLQIRQIRNVTCLCRSVFPPLCALQSSHTLAAIPFLCFWIQNSSLFLERNSLFPQIYAAHLRVWHKYLGTNIAIPSCGRLYWRLTPMCGSYSARDLEMRKELREGAKKNRFFRTFPKIHPFL